MQAQFIKTLSILFLCGVAVSSDAQRRVALVIGNADYNTTYFRALNNPVHDAKSIDSFLRANQFAVSRFENLPTREAIADKVNQFCKGIQTGDVVLFYYSGHGLQLEDKNYLVPTQARLEFEEDIRDRTYELDRLFEQLRHKTSSLNLILLDACRDNPLGRRFVGSKSLRKGLSSTFQQPAQTLISFATEFNRTASDGRGYHSPYTEAILELSKVSCVKLFDFFPRLTDLVSQKTAQTQLHAWKAESLGRGASEFMFVNNNCFITPVIPTEVRWKMISAWSDECLVSKKAIPELVEQLNTSLKGRLHIELVPAPERFSQMFKALQSNEVQLLHGSAYYWKDEIPAAPFFSSVPFGMKRDEFDNWMKREGQALYEALYEHYGIKPFICGHSGQQAGGWFNKNILDTADFRGMWIRMPGLGGKVLEKMGVRNHTSHAKDVYDFLKGWDRQKAAEFTGPYEDSNLGLHQIATYFYVDGWQEPNAAYTLLTNKQAFEQLDANTQALFAAIVATYSERIYTEYREKNRLFCNKFKEQNLKFVKYPETVKNELLLKTKFTIETYIQADECTNCSRIWESYQRYLPNQQLKMRDFNVCAD